ncbi:hypothetical protein COV81_00165 [Candidatus Peregrinibacteria bacterium CG11_big_fil_rev_8_21_14_0_20_41_10]|nr:MAG: hypothetical protein COV81_00165 [Candidatus Peregrinibacteria bacterium CG11_big_fil_rev_8_21_14_0_20_41_10]PIZ73392.1 MAG: hypothetical protein COY06_05375 [Candidatus Peregrinibacteria bacterium CG_4_10_14_0_2_um_filter_41_8]
MGRNWEKAAYGTPVYPFSDTADGRIVTELYKARREAEQQGNQSARLQAETIDAISRNYDGRTSLEYEEFNRAIDDISREIGN